MEFYHRLSDRSTIFRKFQFPTGWNSTKDHSETTPLFRLFQFPTGWNSTVLLYILLLLDFLVSIPNGMEFYPVGVASLRSVRGVSIPNGMEFYLSSRSIILRLICFNSQRDGILLKTFKPFALSCMFQFPTGWNSTFVYHR